MSEETELGTVSVHTSVTDTEEGEILEKYYNDEDILNKEKL